MQNKYYGLKVDITDEEEIENIKTFVSDGTPIILVESLDDLESIYDIHIDDVEMVD